MIRARAAFLAAAFTVLTVGASLPTGSQPRVTRASLLAAEARGAASEADLRLLLDGAGSGLACLRCQAIRALGRLERPALVPSLLAFLSADLPGVRAEAADAAAQSAAKDAEASRLVRLALLGRLYVERDLEVVGALCESLGRLSVAGAEDRQAVEEALLVGGWLTRAGSRSFQNQAPGHALEGALRGLEALSRSAPPDGGRPALSDAARERLGAVVASRSGVAGRRAVLRRLALQALNASGGPSAAVLTSALRDEDPQVRRLAASSPSAGEHEIEGLLDDGSGMVRYEALRALGRRFQGALACEAATKAARDGNAHVSLLALDLLSTCPGQAADLLAREAAGAARSSWRRSAHALLSLASAAPERARPLLLDAARSEPWQARMYAAHAAGVLGDVGTLRRLAEDRDANVREAAVAELSRSAGHRADDVFLSALGSSDHQLVIAAASALEGSPDPRAEPALLAALDRLSANRSDTSRDPRLALLERLKTLGSSAAADRLRPYLGDFDPRVAGSAAGVLSSWSGQPVEAGKGAPPAAEEVDADLLDRLEGAILRFTLEGLGSFDARLLPREAPLTCLRVARLASSGYYDGLTFHRVVPNFVIQGGSPGANEYAGRDPYMRDEVGRVPQRRGTLGISTRGRHTGDAQIYVNLVDSPRLDHEYTVFAEVVRGMAMVDAVTEGTVMARVELVTRGVAAR